MKEFLRRLGLVEDFSTELPIEKTAFVNRLKSQVDEGDIGVFSDPFEVFSSSKNEFKGQVGFNKFKIKRRRRFFDMNLNNAIAQGTYVQEGGPLRINAEINGFIGMTIPFFLLIAFYLIFIGAFFMADSIEGNEAGFVLPFIVIHAAFMFGIPYLVMRRSVKRMKHDLEREFYFMTK